MPFFTQVAIGRREKISVFGDDYPTPDGTCIRDYIHVMDLARGHVAALEHIQPGFDAINLGSGVGVSVLELIQAFQSAISISIPYAVGPRRRGDLLEFYANTNRAKRLLGWQTTMTIEDACRDTWRWQSQNPTGYKK